LLVGPINEVALEREVEVVYLNSSYYKQTAGEYMNEWGAGGVPAIFVINNGEKVSYLYDDEWFNLGLFGDNNVVNVDVIRTFFDKLDNN